MATGACSKQNLMNIFRDNNTQAITAASMRIMVDCVYDNFLDIQNIIDNLNSYYADKALSAQKGAILNDKIEFVKIDIADIQDTKAEKEFVYTKAESDSLYYNRDYIDTNIYTIQEVYTKTDVDNLIYTLQSILEQIDERIDNIVAKNNLIE
jgi:hypothetical protein